MAAANASFCELSSWVSAPGSLPASRPSTPRRAGVSMPSSDRIAVSSIPTNLAMPPARLASMLLPKRDESMLLPVSAIWAVPPVMLANLSSMSAGCLATASASWRAPSGFAARPASPERIVGTAAPTAF